MTGIGIPDEPFTGNSLAVDDFLKMAIAGDYVARYRPGSQKPVRRRPRPSCRMDWPSPTSRIPRPPPHPCCGSKRPVALRPLAELRYPMPVDLPPLPLGDGKWLTAAEDQVSRWQTEK